MTEPDFLLPREERRRRSVHTKMEFTQGKDIDLPISQRLRDTDAKSTEIAKRPNRRVTLAGMKDKIASVEYIYPSDVPHMTIAVAITSTGFAIVGHSAPADPANFNEEYGRELALEQVFRQMWPLEAYLLREEFSREEGSSYMDDTEADPKKPEDDQSGAKPQPDDPKNPAEKELEKDLDKLEEDGDSSDDADEDDDAA